MFKRIILLVSLICIVNIANAETYYRDNKGQYIKDYKKQDIIDEAFSACNCVKESRKLYPIKTTKELNKLCFEAFKEYLLEKSAKYDKIIVESYLTCEEG